jgi:hypothetical protein
MSVLWPKPPGEITCPICGAKVTVRWDKNSQFQSKPYCDSCGWNVIRARTHLFAYLRQIVLIASLAAFFVWAVTGTNWAGPLVAGWMLIVMAIPIIKNLRRLPSLRPVPSPPPLAGISDVGTVTLDVTTPRLKVILEGLIVVASGIAIVFLPGSSTRRDGDCPKHDTSYCLWRL